MSTLANEIYKQLLRRLRGAQHSLEPRHPSAALLGGSESRLAITYGELAAAVSAASSEPVHHRSPRLHAALGELTDACRMHDLPSLPALVWSAALRRPADGYYQIAHPRARTEKSRIAAWEREHERVVREAERFPARGTLLPRIRPSLHRADGRAIDRRRVPAREPSSQGFAHPCFARTDERSVVVGSRGGCRDECTV